MASTVSRSQNVQLTCSPLAATVDEKVSIAIQGLEANQKISLLAKLVGDVQDRYHSLAHYIADQQGQVRLNSQPSVGGSYVGVEPMGFIWSLKPEPGQKPGRRLLKRDVTKPYLVDLEVLDGHLDIQNTANYHPTLCRLTIERHYMAAGVRRMEVREGRLRGTLFLPPGDGPFQGVIDLLGAHGGLMEFKAALLASNGFAALALAYFKHDDLTTNLEELELEYFMEAAEWLKNHPAVIPGGVGVMGISKGAEISLLLASHCKDIKALVFISGLNGFSAAPFLYKKQQIPCYEVVRSKIVISDDNAFKCLHCYNVDWNENVKDSPKAIPVENACGSILIIFGTDDHAYNTEQAASKIYERMKAFGKEAQCTILGYHGAGHIIEPPFSPHSVMSYIKSFDACFSMGGKTKAHSVAQEDAWPKLLNFLQEHLPQRKTNSKL